MPACKCQGGKDNDCWVCRIYNNKHGLGDGCPHCNPVFDRLEWLNGLYRHWEKGTVNLETKTNWYQESMLQIEDELNSQMKQRTMKV